MGINGKWGVWLIGGTPPPLSSPCLQGEEIAGIIFGDLGSEDDEEEGADFEGVVEFEEPDFLTQEAVDVVEGGGADEDEGYQEVQADEGGQVSWGGFEDSVAEGEDEEQSEGGDGEEEGELDGAFVLFPADSGEDYSGELGEGGLEVELFVDAEQEEEGR